MKKRRARDAADQAAEQARARHGRTEAQRRADTAIADATGRALDNARIEPADQS